MTILEMLFDTLHADTETSTKLFFENNKGYGLCIEDNKIKCITSITPVNGKRTCAESEMLNELQQLLENIANETISVKELIDLIELKLTKIHMLTFVQTLGNLLLHVNTNDITVICNALENSLSVPYDLRMLAMWAGDRDSLYLNDDLLKTTVTSLREIIKKENTRHPLFDYVMENLCEISTDHIMSYRPDLCCKAYGMKYLNVKKPIRPLYDFDRWTCFSEAYDVLCIILAAMLVLGIIGGTILLTSVSYTNFEISIIICFMIIPLLFFGYKFISSLYSNKYDTKTDYIYKTKGLDHFIEHLQDETKKQLMQDIAMRLKQSNLQGINYET
ncbi:hypothetical protein J6A31_06410 [bacterium]|nr:hypothetical protein [bacterium]